MFRVVSEDGHPVNGQLTFTLKLPGGAAPSATAPGTPPGGATTASDHDGGATAPGALHHSAQALRAPRRRRGELHRRGSPAGGPSWLADNLLPLTGALLLVVIGAGALLWDRLRH